MIHLRRTVLVLLMLAVPVQGAIAAARTLCVAAAHLAGPMATTGHEHHAHDHGAARDPADPHSLASVSTAAPNLGPAQATAHTCEQCSACGLTAAAPPAALALFALPTADPGFPAIVVPSPHNVADGLERPPRII
jgi:hypothetical protein